MLAEWQWARPQERAKQTRARWGEEEEPNVGGQLSQTMPEQPNLKKKKGQNQGYLWWFLCESSGLTVGVLAATEPRWWRPVQHSENDGETWKRTTLSHEHWPCWFSTGGGCVLELRNKPAKAMDKPKKIELRPVPAPAKSLAIHHPEKSNRNTV